jgi:hypothetical protein
MNRERRRDDLRKARLAFYFALFFSAVAIGFFVPEHPLTLRYYRTVLNAVFWVCIAYAVLFFGFSGVELFLTRESAARTPSRRPAKSD